jgi:gluconolactonase
MPKLNSRPRHGLIIGILALAIACLATGADAREMTKIYDRLLYPEGPVFERHNLLFADMLMGEILRYDEGDGAPIWSDDNCGPTSLARLPSGLWLTSCHLTHELVFLDFTDAEKARQVVREDLRRPNDMSAGAAGVYVTESGEFDPHAPITGKIWLIKAPGEKRMVADNIHYANGVAVTTDGRALLVCEHLAQRVWRYPILPDGTLGPRTLAFDVAKNLSGAIAPLTGPDGIEAAPDGSFYVAINGRASVMHVASGGGLIESFETPGYPFTTNVVLTPAGGGLYAVSNRNLPRQAGALFYLDLRKD